MDLKLNWYKRTAHNGKIVGFESHRVHHYMEGYANWYATCPKSRRTRNSMRAQVSHPPPKLLINAICFRVTFFITPYKQGA